MKKILTFICCLGIVVSSLLFGGSIFCSKLISHSLVNEVVDQIHLEEELNHLFSMINLPDAENESALISGMIEEIVNDDEVINEVNKYTDAFISDIVNDEKTEITSNLNQVIKAKVVAYAKDISIYTNQLISEEDAAAMLSTSVDIADFQGMYQTIVDQMKETFSPTQKLFLKCVHFMQKEVCFYASLLGMIIFSILILLMNFAWLNGLVSIAVSWLLSAIIMFALSKGIPVLFSVIFSTQEAAAGIHDNVAQLTFLSAIYLGISIICMVVKFIYNRFFIKE